ncbi:Galactinol synthase 4 [Zea mays]|uniref:Hexosyltransferase n=1 Tax=Zea mays TaxID=4577 RepID=A0A1D6INX8_MAIZE|nr:Galactinol synthase 4 [Zea mays]
MGPALRKQQQQQQAAEAVAPKQAYVTFLAGDGDYWKGVVGLAKGLRRVRAAYPLVVAVLPDVPEEHRRSLRDQGCVVREFVEYERMVYLDADMQVYENIDHLFDLDKGKFHAVMDCFCEKTWSHTPQYKIGYCQQSPDRVAWPEQELDLPPQPPPLYFNAGMFVHEPSLRTARALLDALAATPPTPFAEQDFLNLFFRDAYAPLPPTYNLVLAMLWRHPDKVALHEVKVVHYCAAGAKPWRYTGKEPNMEREDVRALVAKCSFITLLFVSI